MPDRGDLSAAALATGVGSTPYQYRALVPWVVGALHTVHPLERETIAIVFAAVTTSSLVLLSLVLRRFVALFVPDPSVASVAALSVYAVLPLIYFERPFFPYDIPSVLFFTVGLILIHQRNWLWYYPLFLIATLNRETSLFLTVTFLFALFDRLRPRTLALMTASQLGIWIAVQMALWTAYRDNPWLGYNIYRPQVQVNLETLLTWPVRSLLILLTWTALCFCAATWQRRIDNVFLRRALRTVPVFVAVMFVAGFLLELRIYGEVVPIVLTSAWVLILDLIRQAGRPRLVVPDAVKA